MSYRVSLTIPGSGKKWNMPEAVNVTEWLLYHTTQEYKTHYTGTTHKEWMHSDTIVIDFTSEEDALAFKLKYVCNR